MDFIIRKEEEQDYRIVEEMTKEAFWNLNIPGCYEHYLVHKLRNSKDFIPELDCVAVKDGKIIGHIMFTKAVVIDANERSHEVLTFGPISVLPTYQKQGIGKALIDHSKQEALKLGYNAFIIYGSPDYYMPLGFKHAKDFHISNGEGLYPAAHLALELTDGALKDVSGKYMESKDFAIDEKLADEFDQTFPYKEKLVTDTQARFAEICLKFL